jgi:hypothetical protein
MKVKSVYKFIIPSWAVMPLLFGIDEACTDEDDSENLDIFEASLEPCGVWEFGEGEASFRTNNDVDNMGGDCVEATYTVFEESL